jgi:hypothetical protein
MVQLHPRLENRMTRRPRSGLGSTIFRHRSSRYRKDHFRLTEIMFQILPANDARAPSHQRPSYSGAVAQSTCL